MHNPFMCLITIYNNNNNGIKYFDTSFFYNKYCNIFKQHLQFCYSDKLAFELLSVTLAQKPCLVLLTLK